MQRFDHREYVSMTMEFRCNLRCVHCMIEDTMHRLVPESADRFEELLAQNTEHRRWKGLILTGSEITLRRDLADLARRARAAARRRQPHRAGPAAPVGVAGPCRRTAGRMECTVSCPANAGRRRNRSRSTGDKRTVADEALATSFSAPGSVAAS